MFSHNNARPHVPRVAVYELWKTCSLTGKCFLILHTPDLPSTHGLLFVSKSGEFAREDVHLARLYTKFSVISSQLRTVYFFRKDVFSLTVHWHYIVENKDDYVETILTILVKIILSEKYDFSTSLLVSVFLR